MKKKPLPPPPSPQNPNKKVGASEWMLHLPIGYMQFLFSKLLVTSLAWANGREINLGK